jgi:hypothetical protein
MIEREATVKIGSELLVHMLGEGARKGVNGRLVRVTEDGYYEVTLTMQNGSYTALLPIAGTVIIAMQPESSVAAIEVER